MMTEEKPTVQMQIYADNNKCEASNIPEKTHMCAKQA